jgi:hypothetical protein
VSYEKELSEGPRHTGMSAILGLVAKKWLLSYEDYWN